MDPSIIVGIVFILGYISITLEHNLKVDKLIPALIMMVLSWTIISVYGLPVYEMITGKGLVLIHEHNGEAPYLMALLHHLGKTAEILFFLVGAMTIVEIIDQFRGFSALKNLIKTKEKRKLLWIIAIVAFLLSSVIDNLTTTIVLITILRKLIHNNQERLWYAGIIVIAANAGGAWSPIGDVTTTMLWIAHKIEVVTLIKYLFLPAVACVAVPVFIASRYAVFNGEVKATSQEGAEKEDPFSSRMLVIGLSAILFVPIFKVLTHLPPYMGMMLSLAVVATVAEVVSTRRFNLSEAGAEEAYHSPVHKSLTRIELPSILFFLGILLTVAALESLGLLYSFAQSISSYFSEDTIAILIGVASAVIDNVPLVAASIGMFTTPFDDPFWHLIAYTAGTGGSMLIIGSAAGVVAMGMEKISFFWYFKHIAWLAAIGYVAGLLVFFALQAVF